MKITSACSAVIATVLLAATTTAKQIGNGSMWTDGAGTTASVSVAPTDEGTMVQVTSADGFTSSVEGTGANGSSVNGFPAGTTTGGGHTFRGRNGKVEKKNEAGEWVPMKRTKKKSKKDGNSGPGGSWFEIHLSAGETAPRDGVLHAPGLRDVPLLEGEQAPHSGMLTNEEVVSLPH